MSEIRRRILLALQPALLEGALTEVLSASGADEVVRFAAGGHELFGVEYDAAVICADLPDRIRSRVVITLPDCQGSGGTGLVRDQNGVHRVSINGPEQVIDLIDEYSPRVKSRGTARIGKA